MMCTDAMPDLPEAAVIIPTRALDERASLLRRAIASVLSQEGVRAIPIVVVNGSRWDRCLVHDLRREPQVRFVQIEAEGIPGALGAGRAAVDTPWFSTLDDDDLYLPDAMATRLQALQANPHCDIVVTNGLVRHGYREELHIQDMSSIEAGPLKALTEANWLLPGSWLCRSDSVGASLFADMPEFLECTYLAIQFSLRGHVCFVDRPTIVWHKDTPGSESKSREYILGQESALQRLLELPIPPEFRNMLLGRIAWTRYEVALFHANEGHMLPALQAYLRSLSGPGGWRRVPSLAYLFLKSIAN
jgi:hypothetical protein